MINYEIIDAMGHVMFTLTGSQLRQRMGVTETNPVFTEELVLKFNLRKEFTEQPERIRVVTPDCMF